MRRLLILFIGLAGAAANVRADLLIKLDTPDQTGVPGQMLMFTGTLSNNGQNTIFLNSGDLNLAGTSFTTDFLDPFFANVPVSLDAGQSTTDIELFDVTLNNPFTDGPGKYLGTYDLLGGIDGNAQDVLASADFSVTALPEPEPTSILCLIGALFILMTLRPRIE